MEAVNNVRPCCPNTISVLPPPISTVKTNLSQIGSAYEQALPICQLVSQAFQPRKDKNQALDGTSQRHVLPRMPIARQPA